MGGDLIAHDFSCKFAAVFQKRSRAITGPLWRRRSSYVLRELRGALPGVPVYAALGNNDSDCGDYQLDAKSRF